MGLWPTEEGEGRPAGCLDSIGPGDTMGVVRSAGGMALGSVCVVVGGSIETFHLQVSKLRHCCPQWLRQSRCQPHRGKVDS